MHDGCPIVALIAWRLEQGKSAKGLSNFDYRRQKVSRTHVGSRASAFEPAPSAPYSYTGRADLAWRDRSSASAISNCCPRGS